MRDLVTWVALNLSGNPDPTLTPSFLHYIDRTAKIVAAPPIINFGGGLFGFIPSDTDVSQGTVYVVDNGVNARAEVRYTYGFSHETADQLQVLLLTDTAALALWGGAAPSVGAYRNDAGGSMTAPTMRAVVSTYLYVIQPSIGDSNTGVNFRCDAPLGATFGGSGPYLAGNFISPSTAADKVTWLGLDAVGNPDAAATPTIPVYASRTGTPITPPTVLNVGAGLFTFNPPSADTTTGVVFLIDNGAGRVGRYNSGVSTLATDSFDAVLIVDVVENLWTGAPPSFTIFKDTLLNARLAPTPVPIASPYLYMLLPSISDAALGVAWALDGAPGSLPARMAGNFLSVNPIVAAVTPAPALFQSSTSQGFAQQQDFGTDISTFPDLDPSFALITGNRVLAEALVRRWITVRGTLADAPDYGCDVREYVNEAGVMGNIAKSTLYRMKNVMEAEAKKDQRCANCIVNLDYNQGTQTVVAQAEIDTAGGPFKLELAITSVTVSLLKLG